MRSIRSRFERFSKPELWLSTMQAFVQAIKGQRYSRGRILRAFKALVDREDYAKSDVESVHVPHFIRVTNMPEASSTEDKNAQGGRQKDFTASRTHIWRKGPNGGRIAFWEEKKYTDEN